MKCLLTAGGVVLVGWLVLWAVVAGGTRWLRHVEMRLKHERSHWGTR